ncbi:CIC11C00000001618 [Sungouiella intermedia]|uniref:CIC11C00000001618 n=1 Tax=Sungouiella intermedia TaxID=45354 RepID=A0A1L0BWG0_9ASCO|nr:CIC11C00000001618 [[Candida] intermedia]
MASYSPPLISLSHALPVQPDPHASGVASTSQDSRVPALARNSHIMSGLIPIPASSVSGLLPPSVLPQDSLLRPLDSLHMLDLLPSSHIGENLFTGHCMGGNGGNNSHNNTSSGSGAMDILLASLLLLNLGLLGRRMRSGSLFLTNSIWNDDAVLLHLPLHMLGLGVLDVFQESSAPLSKPGLLFLSPTLSAQPSLLGMGNPTRNRSHTTTAAGHSSLGPIHGLDSSRIGLLPFLSASKNDASLLLDNLVLNLSDAPGQATRNRSQTYLGVTPTIPEIPMAVYPMMTMQGLQMPMHNAQPSQGNHVLASHNLQQGHHLDGYALGNTLGGLFLPYLQNDFDLSEVVITTNFENPNLGPTSTLLFDNVPQFVDAGNLFQLLNNSPAAVAGMHGRSVLSVRVSSMASSKMALVECSSIEVAMGLKANFNHLEIVSGSILYVAFARLAEPSAPPEKQSLSQTPPVIKQMNGSRQESTPSDGARSSARNSTELNKPSPPQDLESSLLYSVSRLSVMQSVDMNKVKSLIHSTTRFPKSKYQTNFGPLPDPIPLRQFDSPKLRELRKILENNERALQSNNRQPSPESEGETKIMSQLELEDLALAMLDELPELCHDHIGNTVVQKLFMVIKSPLIKLMMVREIAPYLTQLSIHKNGTWAIQKIINLCHNDFQQKKIITDSLKPYAVKLFNDQFGNYVLQCCLKFDSPFNDFIFESLIENFIEVSSGRFGARCIRTILETANDSKPSSKVSVTNEQVFLVASLIVEFANELVVNSNGSLLITWFLDTFSGFKGLDGDNRYDLLCEKFMPHLEKLCTHKLAHLIIFKILNHRNDNRVKQLLMDSIFGPYNEFDEDDVGLRPPSALLEAVLLENQEHNAGPLFIYKILSSPILLTFGDEYNSARYQQFVINQVKRVLLEMNIMNLQPYKKLVEEVGLSTNRLNRSSSARKPKRGNSRGNGKSHSPHHQPIQAPIQGQVMPPPMNYMAPAKNGNYPLYAGNLYVLDTNSMGMEMSQPLMNQQGNMLYVSQQRFQQEMTVMQQLEQLSLSSAALGYTSNPGTPNSGPNQRGLFF